MLQRVASTLSEKFSHENAKTFTLPEGSNERSFDSDEQDFPFADEQVFSFESGPLQARKCGRLLAVAHGDLAQNA